MTLSAKILYECSKCFPNAWHTIFIINVCCETAKTTQELTVMKTKTICTHVQKPYYISKNVSLCRVYLERSVAVYTFSIVWNQNWPPGVGFVRTPPPKTTTTMKQKGGSTVVPFCVGSACSPCICDGSLQVFRLLLQKHAKCYLPISLGSSNPLETM